MGFFFLKNYAFRILQLTIINYCYVNGYVDVISDDDYYGLNVRMNDVNFMFRIFDDVSRVII